MSEEAQQVEQSSEDKFFGVTTEFKKENGKLVVNSPEIEVIDDRPPEDQRPPRDASATLKRMTASLRTTVTRFASALTS